MSRSSLTSYALLAVTLGSLIFVGAMCTREQPMKVEPVTLEYWHVYDNEQALQEIAKNFRARYPYVDVRFRRFGIEEYEQKLLNALAAGTGPDLFAVQDTWVGAYDDKVFALPPELTMPTFTVEGGIGKTTVAHPGKINGLRPWEVRDLFADVVANTVVRNSGNRDGGTINGLPLSLDTMVLYVNRGMLASAGIPEPPTTWDQFIERQGMPGMIAQLTRTDQRGGIIQSAISLGGAANIDRASDILSLLMLQNGTPMSRDDGVVSFDERPANEYRDTRPGESALVFYSDFANPTSDAYTWNETLPKALDVFTSGRFGGKSAMFLGYAYDLPRIRQRSPSINLAIRPVPQIIPGQRVDYANFWVTSVSRQTENPNEAWAFLLYAATEKEQAFAYAKSAARPVALRSLINAQRDDIEQEELRPFVDAVLTSQNWYRGRDHARMEETFRQMIRFVVDGTKSSREAIEFGVRRLRE